MSYDRDFDLVLEAATPTELVLARQLLEDAGIPSMAHGPDFDVAELGAAAHSIVRRQSLYVPKDAGERARAILRDAWSGQTLGEIPQDPG